MKTKQLLAGLFVAVTIFTANAQDVSSVPYLTSGGNGAGNDGDQGTYYGHMAGKNTSPEGIRNCFIGHYAGINNLNGSQNVFLGSEAGANSTTGVKNVYIGHLAAPDNFDGSNNVIIGEMAASKAESGDNNVYIGSRAGSMGPLDPEKNTYIGTGAGMASRGSGNVFLGFLAGAGSRDSEKLYIANNDDDTPLIWGDFKDELIKLNGKVGTGGLVNFPSMAGTINVSHYSLFALGGILTEELRIATQTDWADYVFEEDYTLLPLTEVEAFIQENGHLPNVPSAGEIKRDGINVAEMAKIQQEKIEELTLYIIEQQKQNEKQTREIEELKVLVKALAEKK